MTLESRAGPELRSYELTETAHEIVWLGAIGVSPESPIAQSTGRRRTNTKRGKALASLVSDDVQDQEACRR